MMWSQLGRAFGFPGAAEAAALQAARERHPGEPVGWSTVVTDERDRMVVAVTAGVGEGESVKRRSYAVDKGSRTVIELEDTAQTVADVTSRG